jgi:hypothetical protein
MKDSIGKCTIKEALANHPHLKAHNIRRWCREGKITCEINNNEYLMDRASFNTHVAKKKRPIAQGGGTGTPPAAAAPSGAPPATTAEVPHIDRPDTRASMPDSGTRPSSSAGDGPPEGQRPRDRKGHRKETHHEAGTRYRKGPVRHVKDKMRHLDLAQMRQVRDWLLVRMDRKSRPL